MLIYASPVLMSMVDIGYSLVSELPRQKVSTFRHHAHVEPLPTKNCLRHPVSGRLMTAVFETAHAIRRIRLLNESLGSRI